MKVSELAKELGYKAAELVELAKAKGIKVEDPKANVDARMAAAVRAQVPPRSKLGSNPALMDVYTRAVAEEAARAAAKANEPKPEKKPAAEGEPKTKRVVKKKEPVVAKKEEAKPAATAPATAKPGAKKAKVVTEFRIGAADAPKTAHVPAPKHLGLSKEEQEAIKKEASKPLIDVDKVIGEAKELHAMRPIEIEVYTRDGGVEESKDKRHAKPAAKAGPTPAPVAPTPTRPTAPSSPPPRPGAQLPRPGTGGRPPIGGKFIPLPPRPSAQRPAVPSAPRPQVPSMAERRIEIAVPITIKNFCEESGIKVNLVIKKLMEQGALVTNQNATLDQTMVELIAVEFKRDIVVVKKKTEEEKVQDAAGAKDDPKDLVSRSPVVTFMGHVDHGKTSLLDKIRNTEVAAGESGGITQHIGAYKVRAKDGRSVVFLDTPGHEAFTNMRARGAKATDVVVIVVDSSDGVMPQTEEAISHAKAAGVKVLCALNKIDKPTANVMKVKGQLAALGLQPEDWGGTTVCCEVSALTGQGVDHLLEMLALESELLDLKANPKRAATGTVLEARKTDDRGVVADVLVQNGTLRKGDVILSGQGYGRVRSMQDDHGRTVDSAGPATPVEITGLVEVPDAGDTFTVVEDYQQAKEVAESRKAKAREETLLERQHVTLEGLFKKIEEGGLKEVRVVLKTDVKGSLEVLKEALPGLSTDEVKLRILHSGVGGVTEGDILLADASDAIVIGFHVEVEGRAAELARVRGVDIKKYTIIYQVIEEMQAALEGLLEPELVEKKLGFATVREVFQISRVGSIAGCMVSNGKIERAAQVRVLRDGKVVFTGKLENLKRFKDDVKEVAEGYECGMRVAGFNDVRKGDVLEAFTVEKVARKLEKRK